MKLAIFDIDGTLTDTNRVDNACFSQAFGEALGIEAEAVDWDACPHVTDSGIFEFLHEQRFGRKPNTSETREFKGRFMSLLEEARIADASGFREIAGAGTAFRRMLHMEEWVVVIATGCWSESADLKLRAAGIKADGVPAATADDALSRERIVGNAIWKACRYSGYSCFDKMVSIGDGLWDVRTARNLQLSFVGIGERLETLKESGARHALPDLRDFDAFIESLEDSVIPEA